MTIPMIVLGSACVALGFLPGLLLPLVGSAAATWAGLPAGGIGIGDFAELSWLPWAGLALSGLAFLLFVAFALRTRAGSRGDAARRAGNPTWDCGYAAPNARMQYTPSSFGALPLRGLSFMLFPKRRLPRVASAFPAASSFSSSSPDLALDRVIGPLARLGRRMVPAFRVIQQGQTQLYLVYVLVISIILLAVGVGLS